MNSGSAGENTGAASLPNRPGKAAGRPGAQTGSLTNSVGLAVGRHFAWTRRVECTHPKDPQSRASG